MRLVNISIVLILTLLCSNSFAWLPGMQPQEPVTFENKTVEKVTVQLFNQFDSLLQNPQEYKKIVQKECLVFPEGRIYAYAVPALAYANVAIEDSTKKEHSISQMKKLIELLIPVVAEDINAPKQNLMLLTDYEKQTTYLSTLNLVLGTYVHISADSSYNELFTHISSLFQKELHENNGAVLWSYPEYTWYFDTYFALLSLELHDTYANENSCDTLFPKHIAWVQKNALDSITGLPRAYPGSQPRGCDLSMQLCLLAQMDYAYAEKLYKQYVSHFWVNGTVLKGFSEWPLGSGPQFGDFDSGPIIFDVALTATGVGIGTTKAFKDYKRFHQLGNQLNRLSVMKNTVITLGGIPEVQKWFELYALEISANYYSGFLYGDAVLLYALTWTPYPERWVR